MGWLWSGSVDQKQIKDMLLSSPATVLVQCLKLY